MTITRAASHWQPPHPRGLRPHRRLSSMSPARASFGLLRVSPSRYHRMGTKCLACEARFDTCPRGVALGRHIWERLPESLRQQRLWTASLHENQGWSVVGGQVCKLPHLFEVFARLRQPIRQVDHGQQHCRALQSHQLATPIKPRAPRHVRFLHTPSGHRHVVSRGHARAARCAIDRIH